MTTTLDRNAIEAHLVGLLETLTRDWDYSQEIAPRTRLFADLGFESLDAVVLCTAIQDHYQRAMPFSELLAQIGEQGRDLPVGELVDFITLHLGAAPARA